MGRGTRRHTGGARTGAARPIRASGGAARAISLPGLGSRSSELYEYLRAAVIRGTIRPGERLVEETVAQRAGVSRTPVREALHRLEADGLVRSTARGAVVTSFTDEELHDLCAARVGMEGLAARFAAEAKSDLDIAHLRHVQEETASATQSGDVERLVALNHAFHEAVWRACRNRYLSQELSLLRGLIERLQSTTLSNRDRQSKAFHEHDLLLDAIEQGDAQKAEEVCRRHFEDAMALRLAGLVRREQHGLL